MTWHDMNVMSYVVHDMCLACTRKAFIGEVLVDAQGNHSRVLGNEVLKTTERVSYYVNTLRNYWVVPFSNGYPCDYAFPVLVQFGSVPLLSYLSLARFEWVRFESCRVPLPVWYVVC